MCVIYFLSFKPLSCLLYEVNKILFLIFIITSEILCQAVQQDSSKGKRYASGVVLALLFVVSMVA